MSIMTCISAFLILHCYIYAVNQKDRIEGLLQEGENYLAKSENCENQKDFVGALSYCTDASSE